MEGIALGVLYNERSPIRLWTIADIIKLQRWDQQWPEYIMLDSEQNN